MASRAFTPQRLALAGSAPATLPAAVVIALFVLLARGGAFLTEHIDSDEWSYILMGADVAKGHLPFVHQFDLKPPVVFLLFGAVIATFGKSLLAIRLIGALAVFTAAFFTFLIARRATGAWPALAAALMSVALCSGTLGLDTSSELPAIAFMMPATWLLVRRETVTLADAALCGLLVSLAVLTRTNLAVVALAFGLLLLVLSVMRPARCARPAWLVYGLAGLVPLAMLTLVYALAGELATFRLAMIDVPLAYSGQLSALDVLRLHAAQYYYTAQLAPLIYVPMTLLALAGMGASLPLLVRHRRDPDKACFALVQWTGMVAVLASLLIGGAAYPHYWLQVMPFLAIFAALAFPAAARLGRLAPSAVVGAAALAASPVIAVLVTGTAQTVKLAANPDSADRSIRDAAQWIRARGGAGSPVWALHMHLALFYLDTPPLSRAGVYPSNLSRKAIIDTLADHDYVGHDEIGRIMASTPRFIVTDSMGRGRAWVRDAGRDIDGWLGARYRLARRMGQVEIYERI
ncbi:glycosyltransferase family 39 protein [Novosphingobium sp. PY1]|uniref:ArnT family glycosyltransferase n=1 Tax=Novosphingobium sp. PY1 TaxID=1882221 RepID=UPI001A8F0FB1|nr:glycosyltransferase family 39 protein [Novosphingobium sp. PY1]GFM30982.1 putative uncharacterized protein [Novosphingobium sp. PY1]